MLNIPGLLDIGGYDDLCAELPILLIFDSLPQVELGMGSISWRGPSVKSDAAQLLPQTLCHH